MTAHRDLEALLARARRIADAERISKKAELAAPHGEKQPPAGGQGGQISRATPANLANPANHSPESWTPEDWQYLFHERAGFLENDCRQSRLEAEQRALHELEAQWLALNPPAPSDPQNGCVQCRKGVGAADLLPRLACNKSHLWLHQACWPAHEKSRRAEARAVLEEMIPDLPRRDPLEELLEDAS